MRWDNGRIKYSYSSKKQSPISNLDILNVPPIPWVAQSNHKKKYTIQAWYEKFYSEIELITNTYLIAFNRFLETHPFYKVTFDEHAFRCSLLYKLYATSYSSNLQYV